MNLEDFSYTEGDRRYIDPNVSLNEQDAFIQNLREMQSGRNAQIAQQTHDLGTDVPSNLGGLTGSESYFKARYQTPQTNTLVADLKTAAQAQALTEALNNELGKAKKQYNDAYRAAVKRANTSGSGGTTPTNGGSGLTINTDTGTSGDGYVNNENKGGLGRLDYVTDDVYESYVKGKTSYTTPSGEKYWVDNLNAADRITAPFMSGLTQNPASGTMQQYNGKTYLFLNDENTQNIPTWYEVTGRAK